MQRDENMVYFFFFPNLVILDVYNIYSSMSGIFFKKVDIFGNREIKLIVHN